MQIMRGRWVKCTTHSDALAFVSQRRGEKKTLLWLGVASTLQLCHQRRSCPFGWLWLAVGSHVQTWATTVGHQATYRSITLFGPKAMANHGWP